MNELTMAEIVDWFRKKYPDAVMVTMNVGYHTAEILVKDILSNDMSFSMRKLNGEWVEKV
jgi:hypothetical protein